MNKNICVFTTTRADYSLLKNLVLNLQKIKKFKTTLVVSGTHLSKRFGYTLSDVRKDKIKNIKMRNKKNEWRFTTLGKRRKFN